MDARVGGPTQLHRARQGRCEAKGVRPRTVPGDLARWLAVKDQVRCVHTRHGLTERDGDLCQVAQGRARQRINRDHRGRNRINQTVFPKRIGCQVVQTVAGEIRDVVAAVPTGFHNARVGRAETESVNRA